MGVPYGGTGLGREGGLLVGVDHRRHRQPAVPGGDGRGDGCPAPPEHPKSAHQLLQTHLGRHVEFEFRATHRPSSGWLSSARCSALSPDRCSLSSSRSSAAVLPRSDGASKGSDASNLLAVPAEVKANTPLPWHPELPCERSLCLQHRPARKVLRRWNGSSEGAGLTSAAAASSSKRWGVWLSSSTTTDRLASAASAFSIAAAARLGRFRGEPAGGGCSPGTP